MDHQVDGRRQLVTHGPEGEADVGEEHHRLQPAEGVARAVGVAGGQGPLVAAVHGLEHVQGLAGPALAHHDAIRSHPQGVAHQGADRHPGPAVGRGRAGLEAHHVVAGQTELGGVLDGDHALADRDAGGESVEEGGLARPRAAAGHDVAPGVDGPRQQVGHARWAQLGQGDRPRPETTDGEAGAVDGERGDHHVDP